MAGTEEKKIDSNIEERNSNVTESQVNYGVQKCQPGSCAICYPQKIVSTSGNIEKIDLQFIVLFSLRGHYLIPIISIYVDIFASIPH